MLWLAKLPESHLNDKHEQQNHMYQLKIFQHLCIPFTFHAVGNLATDT